MENFEEPDNVGTVTKGKQAEFVIIGKLLERGYEVYLPVVDTGIDFLVDVGEGRYREIQVKYREDEPVFNAREFKSRDSLYFVCFLRGKHGDDFWILPSRVFQEKGKATKIRNKDYVQFRIGKEGSETYGALAGYHSNFGILLSGATKEVRKTVERETKRIGGEHFKQLDFMREVLIILSEQRKPLQTKEIMKKLEEKLRERFSEADLELTKGNEVRWKKTAAFAIYHGLKDRKLIEAPTKNQWVLTDKGKVAVEELIPIKLKFETPRE